MTPRLFQYCRDRQDWLLDLIHALVTIESPTDNKGAVDRCGAVLADRLRSIGAAVTAVPQTAAGDHLLARFGTGGRQVLVIGHFDTVWPLGQLDRMPFREDAGRLHGPGVLDMKAGIALGMLATRALVDLAPSSDTRITMLWTTDEETGSDTSRALIEAEARQSEAVLVLEPALAGGALKTARKGVGQYELSVHGLSAHAGVDPRKGVNAIRELALQVLAVDAIRDLDRGISVNVGVISGGTRSNVVPDFATASVDVRAETHGRRRWHRPGDARARRPDGRRAPGSRWRLQSAADGTLGGRGSPLRDRSRMRGGDRHRAPGGGDRRRLGRELHGGARRAHP